MQAGRNRSNGIFGPVNWKEPKLFRKGEVVYHASEPATHVYLIQSGLVALMYPAGDNWVELSKVTAPQMFGEEALWDSAVNASTATAVNDSRIVMIPMEQARIFFGSLAPALRLLFKSIIEKQNGLQSEVQALRLETDPTPCPSGAVTKLFATLHTVATYTGTVKGSETQVVWQTFKKYSQRTFLESPVRLEQAVNILVNLGYARLEMVKSETDPEAPDELGFVHFNRLEAVQEFFQFYREHRHDENIEDALSTPTLSTEQKSFFRAVLEALEDWNRAGRVAINEQAGGKPLAA